MQSVIRPQCSARCSLMLPLLCDRLNPDLVNPYTFSFLELCKHVSEICCTLLEQPLAVNALTLLVGRQEEHLACKNWVTMFFCGYLCGTRCRLFAYGPGDDATASRKPHHLLHHIYPDWFYLSGTGLPSLSCLICCIHACTDNAEKYGETDASEPIESKGTVQLLTGCDFVYKNSCLYPSYRCLLVVCLSLCMCVHARAEARLLSTSGFADIGILCFIAVSNNKRRIL